MPLPNIDFEAALEQVQCIGDQHPEYQSSAIHPYFYITPRHRDLDIHVFIHLKNGKMITVCGCKTEAEMFQRLQAEMNKVLAGMSVGVAA